LCPVSSAPPCVVLFSVRLFVCLFCCLFCDIS
jgi:hypothetical protein